MLSPRARTPGKSLLGTPVRVSRNAPGSKIRVVCRVRPFLSFEQRDSCLTKDHGSEAGSLHVKDKATGRSETYKLDHCYGEEDHITYIFKMELESILPFLFRGCNATVFAYGATGSGKTHTMQGVGEDGLIPLSLQAILTMAKAMQATVNVSFYEIYMDRCYDLLEQKQAELCVLEDTNGRIQLRGLSQVQVRDFDEFQALYSKGCSRRKVGQTGLNDLSSRGHAVWSVLINTGELENSITGKLNLIDLAGNEDNRRSGNEGVRLAESSRINQSLFALSNVINALNTNESRIPYRDSKLTRILQDSLGGTSMTLMIACLNPGSFQEAVHTLNLAAKSKQIVNKYVETPEPAPKVNMEAKLKAWRDERSKTCLKSPTRALFASSSSSCLLKSPPAKASSCINSPATRVLAPVRSPALSGSAEQAKLKFDTSEPALPNIKTSEQLSSDRFPAESPEEQVTNEDEKEKENLAPASPFSDEKLSSPKSPPLSVKLRGLGSSLREALTPLPSNSLVTTKLTQLSICDSSPAFHCSSWESPLVVASQSQTPLEKLNSTSRSIQDTLMKDYVEVLNKGSREELLALKGIGMKRADYILKLRETESSPIKQLDDLKKIGLSEKLACRLFNGNIARQLWSTPK